MIEILIALTIILTVFLSAMSIFQKIKTKEREHKKETIETQLKNLKFIDETIALSCDLPISTQTKLIMLARKLFSIKLIRQCAPDDCHYTALYNCGLAELQETKLLPSEKGLPSPINETHMIQMIRTLRRIEAILNIERKRKAYSEEYIMNELSRISFFSLYLKANNLITLATYAIDNDCNGTARERLEATTGLLSKTTNTQGQSWIEAKIEFCKNKLQQIQNNMRENNQNHIKLSNLQEENDDTGLSRMFDQKKSKVLYKA
jgi:hypothetical protein